MVANKEKGKRRKGERGGETLEERAMLLPSLVYASAFKKKSKI